jgi:hypothetical protein
MELINLYIDDSLEDKSGVSAIALVDSPATEESWIAFNKQSKGEPKKYTIQCGAQKGNFTPVKGDQQVLAGALMIPNKNIYRIDNATGQEYEVTFSPETIKKIQSKHSQLGLNKALNHMHDSSQPVNGYLLQHFCIDREQGILPPFGQEHLEDGTWYGYIKVNDVNVWNNFVKTGVYTGFSVEGFFYEQKASEMSKEDLELLSHLLENL